MKFVRTEDLKAGMRLAKPIYNKKGVLLYERNSALTAPGIASAKNFGLIGVYILEPAEPLPPLSREDLEFTDGIHFPSPGSVKLHYRAQKTRKIPGISGRYPFPLRVFKTPCEF